MRVAIVGHQTDYSRTRVLRQALAEYTDIATQVVDVIGESTRSVRRQFRIFRAAMRHHRTADILFLPALNQKEILALWAASRVTGKLLVTDMLISSYDTLVDDRQLVSPSAARAVLARRLDRIACTKSDMILCDTKAHVAFFVDTYAADPRRCAVVRVGAERAFFQQQKTTYALPPSERMRVLFYGGFSPLHGIPSIIDAARVLDAERFQFVLIGSGQVWHETRASIARAGIQNVTLAEPVPYVQLPDVINSFDVGLGIFGAPAKARRVVPNKVYQMAAGGLPVVTVDSPAIREVFEPDRSIVVSDGTGEAIAAALRRLHESEPYRRCIGVQGKEAVERVGHPEAVARQLSQALRGLAPRDISPGGRRS